MWFPKPLVVQYSVGMPIADPAEAREYQRKYQKDNRKNLTAKKAERVQEQRDYIWSKKSCPCKDCGVQYPPWVMEFDHVRGVKRYNLSKLSRCQASWKTIDDEIAKCEVVCANCHRDRTYRRLENGS